MVCGVHDFNPHSRDFYRPRPMGALVIRFVVSRVIVMTTTRTLDSSTLPPVNVIVGLSRGTFASFSAPFPSFPVAIATPHRGSAIIVSSTTRSNAISGANGPFSLTFYDANGASNALVAKDLGDTPVSTLETLKLCVSRPPPAVDTSAPDTSTMHSVTPELSKF